MGANACGVKASSTYYCNVAGCRGLIGSPMGVEDYSLAEATALNVGASCNLPGTRALGRLQADGSCKCEDRTCEDLNRIYATLPRCTNQVMRAPGATTCLSCGSMYPAGCGAPNVVVPDCSFACRP
ncbi:MAG: hypothetical protein M0D55_18110 [Elusimicrobiota bacterium]|nr:MAG: hypothetical protein M0D55_18110 [Elusimicrobiota bacterium]